MVYSTVDCCVAMILPIKDFYSTNWKFIDLVINRSDKAYYLNYCNQAPLLKLVRTDTNWQNGNKRPVDIFSTFLWFSSASFLFRPATHPTTTTFRPNRARIKILQKCRQLSDDIHFGQSRDNGLHPCVIHVPYLSLVVQLVVAVEDDETGEIWLCDASPELEQIHLTVSITGIRFDNFSDDHNQ